MNNTGLVTVVDGQAVTSSMKIAEVFEKEHKNVIKKIGVYFDWKGNPVATAQLCGNCANSLLVDGGTRRVCMAFGCSGVDCRTKRYNGDCRRYYSREKAAKRPCEWCRYRGKYRNQDVCLKLWTQDILVSGGKLGEIPVSLSTARYLPELCGASGRFFEVDENRVNRMCENFT